MTRRARGLRPVIGLLGGVAAGKSLVASQFAQLGCAVVDADRVVHQLLREPHIRRAVRRRFGPGVMDASGEVDRQALAAAAFADRSSLEALEALVHPETCRRLEAAVAEARRQAVPAVVLDAPLILEKGLDRLCDVLVYVRAPREVRRRRAGRTRGWDAAEVARREATQISLKTKRHRADYTVDNRTSPEHTFEQVRTILSRVAK
ncbi:MAG: dephospho-CoA kinase [Planctomycetes bacterium]|nr:dephospho-CoA kinase [Planctomycetota bacterium]